MVVAIAIAHCNSAAVVHRMKNNNSMVFQDRKVVAVVVAAVAEVLE